MIFDSAKALLERATGARIYRNSLPRGLDLFRDLGRVQGWNPHGGLIFDVGAHVGSTVARFRSAYPTATVYAFEPASENRSALERAFGSDPHVRIQAQALGRTEGAAMLHLAEHSAMHSLVAQGRTRSEPVTTTTLDAFCERNRVPEIRFCKIDTEGADLQVLEGGRGMLAAQHVDFIQVETTFRHDTQYFAPIWAVDRLMHAHRYELFGIYEQQPCWTGRQSLLFLNAVYVRMSLVEGIAPW